MDTPGCCFVAGALKKDMSVNKLGEGLRGLEEERKEQLRRRRKSGTLAEMVVPKLKEKDLTRIQRTSKNRNRFWKHMLKIVGRSVCLKVFFECQKTVRSAVAGATTKKLEWIRPKNQGKFHVSLKFSSHAHYVIRCGEQECRHRLNVVRTGPWPLDTCRSLTLQQVDEMLSWEDAKVKPPSPREISKRVKCSKYASSQFLDFLTRKTAAVSKAQASGAQPLPVIYRLKNVYEIDGTGIGKFYAPWR